MKKCKEQLLLQSLIIIIRRIHHECRTLLLKDLVEIFSGMLEIITQMEEGVGTAQHEDSKGEHLLSKIDKHFHLVHRHGMEETMAMLVTVLDGVLDRRLLNQDAGMGLLGLLHDLLIIEQLHHHTKDDENLREGTSQGG